MNHDYAAEKITMTKISQLQIFLLPPWWHCKIGNCWKGIPALSCTNLPFSIGHLPDVNMQIPSKNLFYSLSQTTKMELMCPLLLNNENERMNSVMSMSIVKFWHEWRSFYSILTPDSHQFLLVLWFLWPPHIGIYCVLLISYHYKLQLRIKILYLILGMNISVETLMLHELLGWTWGFEGEYIL